MKHNSGLFSTKNRRALSTVVTSAILMTGAALMGTMSLAWSTENLTTQQNNLLISYNANMNKLNEDLLVENIWYGSNPDILNITFTNSGTVTLNVTEMWVENSTSKLIFYYPDFGMLPGNSNSTQESLSWNSGESMEFTLFTDRGNIFTVQDVT